MISILNAVTSDLASLINRLDLQATPDASAYTLVLDLPLAILLALMVLLRSAKDLTRALARSPLVKAQASRRCDHIAGSATQLLLGSRPRIMAPSFRSPINWRSRLPFLSYLVRMVIRSQSLLAVLSSRFLLLQML